MLSSLQREKAFTILVLFMLTLVSSGCVGPAETFRNLSDFDQVKERFPTKAVAHFPRVPSKDAILFASFVGGQGGSGMQLGLPVNQEEYAQLLKKVESKNYEFSIGIAPDEPTTMRKENASSTPYISLYGKEGVSPTPEDLVFTIATTENTKYGYIFRSAKQDMVIFWIVHYEQL